MKLSIGVMAQDRLFEKAMMRIRPDLNVLKKDIENVVMVDPLQTSTLIVVTDDGGSGTLKEVATKDGTFQVIAGCASGLSDSDLKREISRIVKATIEASSFSNPDRESFINIVDSWVKLHELK